MDESLYVQIQPLNASFREHSQSISKTLRAPHAGFTSIELLIIVAIVGILAGIAIPAYLGHIEKAKVAKAIAEIRIFEKEILAYKETNNILPNSLDDIGRGSFEDPWGSPYEYLTPDDPGAKGKRRKKNATVPLNSDFDLYSKGKDGASQPPLTAKASRNDIVRADNGRYVGLGLDF